ncbi:hypothetical protein [Aliivibrio sp.]
MKLGLSKRLVELGGFEPRTTHLKQRLTSKNNSLQGGMVPFSAM